MSRTAVQQPIPFPGLADEVSLQEALSNAQRRLADESLPLADDDFGASLPVKAHLPSGPGSPELYALCPGCQEHPSGGIFPVSGIAVSQNCPTGRRLADSTVSGKEECRGALREGMAPTGSRRQDMSRPSSFLHSFQADRSRSVLVSPDPEDKPPAAPQDSLTPGTDSASGPLFILTLPVRLCSDLLAQLEQSIRRAWFFHRRKAVCQKRLSRIARIPSSTS